MADQSWWNTWGPTLLGGGLGLLGAGLQSSAVNKGNDINAANSDRLFKLGEQETQRRNALTQLLMPQLLRNMRYKHGPQINQEFNRQASAPAPQQFTPPEPPVQPEAAIGRYVDDSNSSSNNGPFTQGPNYANSAGPFNDYPTIGANNWWNR